MLKYKITYVEKKGKFQKNHDIIMEAENLIKLYALLEKSNINHIIGIEVI